MTDKQMALILADMVVLTDSREQRNEHIIEYLDNNNIKHQTEKLDSGDYSFILPNYPELNLDKLVIIEKKNSLDEISQNFTKGRDRFTREFERVPEGTNIHLVIENTTWKKLINGSYRSKLPPNSFMASLLSFSIRYDIKTWFVGKDESAVLIYKILYYELFERLKNMREVEL